MGGSKKVNDPDRKWYHIPGLTDKQMHGAYGFAIGALFSSIFGFPMWIIATITFAGGKELNDLFDYGESDYMDFTFTLIGGACGALFIYGLKYILWTF